MYPAEKGEFEVYPTVHRNPKTTGGQARGTIPAVRNSKRQLLEPIARAQETGRFEETGNFRESFCDSRSVDMVRLDGQGGPRKLGFVLENDIRSRHYAILKLSDDVLGEIQLDELGTDALGQAAQARSTDRDRLLSSRAPISLENPLNDSSSGLGSEFLANERNETPACLFDGSKLPCKYEVAISNEKVYPIQRDVSISTTGSKPSKKSVSSGHTMSSNRETSNNQDSHKTEAKTGDWEGTFSKNTSSVLDLLPKTLNTSSDEQAPSARQIQSCNFAKFYSTFSDFLPNETQNSRLGQFSGKSPIVKGEIPDDKTLSEVVKSNQEETALSKQDPGSLLDLVPDVPKDIINICWRYQDLDDTQLEKMRHYMIAKAFGGREKVLQESIP